MNREELKDKIVALIEEYETEHDEQFDDEYYFEDDYPDALEEDLDQAEPTFKPSEVESYCSPELLRLIANTGPYWKDKFTDCSIRVYGCDAAGDEVLLAYNDTMDAHNSTELNSEISGTAKVFEIISNSNQDLYFNGTMGTSSWHPVHVATSYLCKESTLVMGSFNITTE